MFSGKVINNLTPIQMGSYYNRYNSIYGMDPKEIDKLIECKDRMKQIKKDYHQPCGKHQRKKKERIPQDLKEKYNTTSQRLSHMRNILQISYEGLRLYLEAKKEFQDILNQYKSS
jgi:hypothetical protein